MLPSGRKTQGWCVSSGVPVLWGGKESGVSRWGGGRRGDNGFNLNTTVESASGGPPQINGRGTWPESFTTRKQFPSNLGFRFFFFLSRDGLWIWSNAFLSPAEGRHGCLIWPTSRYIELMDFLYFFLNFLFEIFREKKGEWNIDLLLHLFMHSLVDFCLCPQWGLNPQSCRVGMML